MGYLSLGSLMKAGELGWEGVTNCAGYSSWGTHCMYLCA